MVSISQGLEMTPISPAFEKSVAFFGVQMNCIECYQSLKAIRYI